MLCHMPVRGRPQSRPPPSRQGILKEEPPSPHPAPTVLLIFEDDPDGTRGPPLALSSSLGGLGGKRNGLGVEAIRNGAEPQSLDEPGKNLAHNVGFAGIHLQLRAQGERVSRCVGAPGGIVHRN